MKDDGGGCFLIIVLIILFFTNPEKSEHRTEVGNVLHEAISEDIHKLINKYCEENPSEFCSGREGDASLDAFVAGISKEVLKEQVQVFVDEDVSRKNFYLFSLTTINGNIVGVGILNMVFVSSDEVEEDFLDNVLF